VGHLDAGLGVFDLDDVVQRGITVAKDGEKLWPPPPVQVSAAPAGAAAAQAPEKEPSKPVSPQTKLGLAVLGLLAFLLVNGAAPDPIPQHFTVLMLAIVVGFYVIGHVHHALHTPLMSVTNAISGVIVVGALLQLSFPDTTIQILAGVAVLLASINVFGGFAVTRRMLAMFSKS
jgi:NAD(P) transhydrogenase subunit alpha